MIRVTKRSITTFSLLNLYSLVVIVYHNWRNLRLLLLMIGLLLLVVSREGLAQVVCDSRHWRDVLLRFGPASGHLRETVTGLC